MQNKAVQGVYSGVSTRQGSTEATIQIKIPLERLPAFYAMFGVAMPGDTKWVAIALMGAEAPVTDEPVAAAIKRQSHAQLAGILCNDATFHEFMFHRFPNLMKTIVDGHRDADSSEIVKRMIYSHCKIESRKEITLGTEAERVWLKIVSMFSDWKAANMMGAR